MSSIKEDIKGQVHFQYYRDGEMWYKTDNGFLFPVPVKDKNEIGNATFYRDDKGIMFMRYIRKYKKELENESKRLHLNSSFSTQGSEG